MAPSSDPGFKPIFQLWAHMCGGNDRMVTLCLHPQHMKVVIDLACVYRGCEILPMTVWSLYQCTRASYGAQQ
jgi:hypothetical protein